METEHSGLNQLLTMALNEKSPKGIVEKKNDSENELNISTIDSSDSCHNEHNSVETRVSLARGIVINQILGHYYQRGKVVRFRTASKEFDMISILSLQDIMDQHSTLLKDYLRSMSTKAINTLIRRHPEALELLRKEQGVQKQLQ